MRAIAGRSREGIYSGGESPYRYPDGSRTDCHAHFNPDEFTDQHAYCDFDACANLYTDAESNADPDSNTHRYAYPGADEHAYASSDG